MSSRDPDYQKNYYRSLSPEKRARLKAMIRDWTQRNKERCKINKANWNKRNPEKYRAIKRNNLKNRAKNNPGFKIGRSMRKGMRDWLDGAAKKTQPIGKFQTRLGYSPAELAAHIERQFLKGMTWANYGDWHIDHIIPLSSFTITGVDDPNFAAAWALSNLRPLWATDNISKGNQRLTLL